MNQENNKERMLDRLLEANFYGQPAHARVFLQDVIALIPDPDDLPFMLPIARYLLCYPEWDSKLTARALIAFCQPRMPVWESIRGWFCQDEDHDPEAEYMTGVAISLADEIGLRPTTAGAGDQPQPDAIDYLAVTRGLVG